MDILKQELEKKRQNRAEETGGRKFFKRSEIEQKRIQKLREEEKHESEAKRLRQSQNQSNSSSSNQNSSSSNPNFILNSSIPNSTVKNSSVTVTDEEKIDSLNLVKSEVIRRLRFLKQPVTLFGESDDDRLDRLKYVLKAGLFELDDSDMTEGQTNDFLRDIVELKKRQKSGLSDRKRKSTEEKTEDKECGNGEEDEDCGEEDNDKDGKRMKAEFNELCDEDKILVFFKKLLIEWNQELDEMSEIEKRTAKGKSTFATFKQCARYLNPLFKFCRKKV